MIPARTAPLAFGCSLLPVLLAAATLPSGFTETRVAAGLTRPTAMAFAPDGRIFVCEQGGDLRVVKDGVLLPTPFVRLTVNDDGERGLLGVAFHPDFESNGWVYVYYTATKSTIHNRVSRFTANGDRAVPGSQVVIMDLDPLSGATNHNGGAIHFGPDGKLYVAVGDNANGQNAQMFANMLGKILRVNDDGTIPTDNPFYDTVGGNRRRIWAYGLRNPFTFAFQPGSGRMFINDVGQQRYEEVNDGVAGANYGWPETEGPTNKPAYRSPVLWYGHDAGCAITGGAFHEDGGSAWPPSFLGDYYYADFCGGWIRRWDPVTNLKKTFASGINDPVDLVFRGDSLYYLARGVGEVWRIHLP